MAQLLENSLSNNEFENKVMGTIELITSFQQITPQIDNARASWVCFALKWSCFFAGEKDSRYVGYVQILNRSENITVLVTSISRRDRS